MSKPETKTGVGQLTLTFPPIGKDETWETEEAEKGSNPPGCADGSMASIASSAARKRPWRKQKWHSLIDKVYAPSNLWKAWCKVAANDGAPGVDGVTVTHYEENVEQRLHHLSLDLRSKTYRPKPVRRVYIPKAGGGRRPLGIPTVRDRIVQQAVLQILEPIFEVKFSKRSHGFRPGRGCSTALSVVDQAVRHHAYQWVVDADIQAFFDSVDHEKMLTAVNEEVADGSLLKLVRLLLTAGVIELSVPEVEPTEMGTPQGGPLSPLLANVYLHAFDVAMAEAGYGLVRYADDFVIFAKSESEAGEALQLAKEMLEGRLGLTLHPEKTRIVSVDAGFEFLGYHYFRDQKAGRLIKEVRAKSVRSFREAVRKRTPRLRTQRRVKAKHCTLTRLGKNQRVRAMVRELERYLTGWHGYFKGVQGYRIPFKSFDGFVRRRIRLAMTGRVGNGWWNRHITNNLIQQLGLTSLDERHQRYLNGLTVHPARKGELGGEPYAAIPHVRFGWEGG